MKRLKNFFIKPKPENSVLIHDDIQPVPSHYCTYFAETQKGNNPPSHPITDTGFEIDDLSFNALVTMKWLDGAHVFFTDIIDFIENHDELNLNVTNVGLNSLNVDMHIERKPLVLLVDERQFRKTEDLLSFKTYITSDPGNKIFTKNTRVHIKLQMNLPEFLYLSSGFYTPTMAPLKRSSMVP